MTLPNFEADVLATSYLWPLFSGIAISNVISTSIWIIKTRWQLLKDKVCSRVTNHPGLSWTKWFIECSLLKPGKLEETEVTWSSYHIDMTLFCLLSYIQSCEHCLAFSKLLNSCSLYESFHSNKNNLTIFALSLLTFFLFSSIFFFLFYVYGFKILTALHTDKCTIQKNFYTLKYNHMPFFQGSTSEKTSESTF